MKSWIESANGGSDFPLQNLPLGVMRRDGTPRIALAIGDLALDLAGCVEDGLLAEASLREPALNGLMARGHEVMSALRAQLRSFLSDSANPALRSRLERHLVRQSDVTMVLPATIGDYSDFYASIHHATNVGSMFRPDNPLLPNYKWVPIGYHGRASSIVVSGTSFRRPSGQTRDDASAPPVFGPTRRLDYELEVGAFVGRGNELGVAVSAAEAEDRIFGLCLVNDWSARDVQPWEYQPLGPFLAKSFLTSISPWVVTTEALEPFRVAPAARAEGDPAPLPHLVPAGPAWDITLEVWLRTSRMQEPVRLTRSSFRDMYWTMAQMLAHHTSNGCNLRPGDLIASGTVSGPSKDARGCMLELSWRGTEPIQLPTGEERKFLADGDEVVIKGYCEKDGARIGFGECRGVVQAG